jgi:hypothetical protein
VMQEIQAQGLARMDRPLRRMYGASGQGDRKS